MSAEPAGLAAARLAPSGLLASASRSPRASLALAVAVAAAAGAVYPVSALAVHPLALPVAFAGVALAIAAAGRPGLAVAVAFALTALGGAGAWVPGLGWTVLLFALLLLRPDPVSTLVSATARLPPLSIPVILYVITVLISFAMSPDQSNGLPILRSVVTGALLFFVIASIIRTTRAVQLSLAGASLGGLLTGGLATFQHATGASSGIGFITSTGELVGRATGGFAHPNQLAGYLVLLVPLAVAGALVDRRFRPLHLAALMLELGGIYASYSRGAWLAVAVLPFLLLRGRSVLLLVPAVTVALLVGVPPIMQERFATGDSGGGELAGRVDIWSTASSIWIEQPVLGSGLGSFPARYSEIRVIGKQFLENTAFLPPPHAHNLGLQLLAEQGVVGAASFIMLLGAAAVSALRLRQAVGRGHSILAAGLLSALVAFLVHNAFDVTLLENTGVQFFGALGMLSALVAMDREGAGADESQEPQVGRGRRLHHLVERRRAPD